MPPDLRGLAFFAIVGMLAILGMIGYGGYWLVVSLIQAFWGG